MWHKMLVAAHARNASRRAYSHVWRTRPDSRTTPVYPWAEVALRLEHNAYITFAFSWWEYHHTDIDLIFGVDAAEVADSVWARAPSLYSDGVPLHPETMYSEALRRSGMDCMLLNDTDLEVCSVHAIATLDPWEFCCTQPR